VADKNDKNYDRLWEIMEIFFPYSVLYIPNFTTREDYLVIYEVIIVYSRSVVFRHYILKKHKYFRFKIYKPCDATGYI
jgi:hypothetical protein